MKKLETIVCIDDEPDILELISMALTLVGKYKVVKFSDALSAIAGMRTLEADLILIDGMMAEMSGMDAFEEIRKIPIHKETPIVFMTARVQPHEQEEYAKMGAAGVIAKPFDPMKLSSDIAVLWAQSQNGKSDTDNKGA